MKATKKVFIAVAALAIVATAAYAAVLLTETFAYPDGDLVGQGGWVAHSSAGSKPVQVVSGQASLDQSGGSAEDVNTPFPQQSDVATTYACFEITIPSQGPLGPASVGTDPLYVAHFKQPGAFFYFARVWVSPPTSGGNFQFGLTSSSGTAANVVPWGVDSFFDVTYKIAISYDAATGESRMWVDPADQNDTSIGDPSGFTGDLAGEFALRQASPGGLGAGYYCLVDNIKVAQAFHEACDTPVQIDNTTWGQVKGIYR